MAVPLASAFVRVRPQVDKKEFEKDGRAAGEAAGKSFSEGFYRDAAGRLRAANGRFATDAEKASFESGGRSGKSFSKGFEKSVSKGRSSTLARVASITASRYTLIGGAAVLATPGVLHLTAALLPALGAINALPAAIGAAGAAAATLKIATAGVGDAISKGLTGTSEQAEKAMKGIPPAAQKFARSIIALKPQVDRLRQSVSERFFRPLLNDITPLTRIYFPLLTRQMSNLAGPLGGLAEQLAKTGRSGLVVQTVAKLFGDTRQSVILLRGAIDPLVKAFAAIISSTSRSLPGLAQSISDLAVRFNAFIQNAAASGSIFRAFQAGMATLRDLGGIVINVGSIFRSVLGAAASGSVGLLGNLKALTGQAAEFLKSAQGMSALTAIFSTLSALGAALRTALGGLLPQIAEALAVLGPALAGMAEPAAQLVVALGPLLPLLAGIAATIIIQLTPALAALAKFLSEHATLVRVAAVALGVWVAALKVSTALIAVQAAGGLLSYLKGIQLVSAATKIWAGIQIAFNAIMALNPFVLVTLAIIALVAAIVYAYKHSETFRKIVQAVWGAIKVAIQATVDWIVGTAWPAIKKAWDAIAAAAMWLWHNVIEPVWNGIKAVISVVATAIKSYIEFLVAAFRLVAGVATWLWHNIFAPVFAAIRKIVEVWWLAVQIIFKGLVILIRNQVVGAINFWKGVFTAVFNFVKDKVVIPWWTAVRGIFNLFRQYILGPVISGLRTFNAFVVRVFNTIAALVRAWWTAHISPIFAAVRAGWDALAAAFTRIYNTKIKPLFNLFIGFIRNEVVNGFKTAVSAITKAWDGVRAAARVPVAFVVNHVINPFIGGLNKAAAVVGVKDRVEPIKGFRQGGKISGTGGISDNRQAVIPGVGAVQLQGGEFVVRREMTAKAFPLLKWINAGMQGGATNVARRIGRPVAELPGDGSEGFAFRDGGLIGWAKDVWGAVTNPAEAIKKPFESALNGIPGSGMIKSFLIGAAKKLLDGAVGWLGRIGGSGSVGKAVKFLHGQDGKPYGWAQAGPNAYDCSGIVAAVYNIMHNRSPYSHTFSTANAGSFFPKPGQNGPMAAAWSHPGQSPASASVGHMMGRVGNLNFESTGSRGVHLGGTTRKLSDFANIGHYRGGGLLTEPIRLFDSGGLWPSGTLGANLSGRTEYVDSNRDGRAGRTIEFHAHFHAPVGDKRAAADLVYGAWKTLRKDGRIS